MRDLEFLPDWYPHLRQRKRLMRLQAYMTLLLAMGLGLWLSLVHRNIQFAEGTLAETQRQVSQTDQELGQLQEQISLKNQLLLQRRIVDCLGLPVQMSRMLGTLDAKMPHEMCLTDCTFETQEQIKTVSSLTAARTVDHGNGTERRLRIHLQGVAPSDDDIANFLANLTNVPFFDQVSMTYSRDRSQDGRIMREFEITFMIDLDQQVAGAEVGS